MTKDTSGAAFPFSPNDQSTAHMATNGMSLRDWFAGQALITLGDVNPHLPNDAGSLREWPEPQELAARRAKWAYLQADAMLAARALAPIDGLALVRELRDRAEKAETLRDEAVEKYAAGVDKRLADQTRAESAEAERDRLAAANAVLEAKVAGLVEALKSFIWWADQKCPCHNEEPNPCTLCGASVENLEPCKAADRTLPPHLLRQARAALATQEAGNA